MTMGKVDKTTPIQLPGETWKMIQGSTGYEVSDLGRVRSFNYTRRRNTTSRAKIPVILTGGVHGKGYICHKIKFEKGFKTVTRCKLVLEAFVGPAPVGMECCHGNGNSRDDRLVNLRWDTPSNNQQDKLKHGTHLIGADVNTAKLTDDKVRQIRAIRKDTRMAVKVIATKFGVRWQTIADVVQRRTWKHVK